ncbi:MAG: NAD-dependent epimerase/dehydratase family protein [Nitrospirales bacterium]|nr:NAD-dependent epimerase/dehydratase family protein [Nitrospirales bacterium]
MKVLVIGASGQLGSNLVRALLNRGDQVRGLTRPTSKMLTLEGLDFETVTGDLAEIDSVTRACRGVQIVYQTAGYYPTETIPVAKAKQQALAETKNLLHAVGQSSVERMVFASTLTTVGFPKVPGELATEECPFFTRFTNNPYLVAKAAMEDEVLAAARKGLPAVVVNPTAFFGPYDQRPTSGTQILMIAKRQMPGYVQGPVNVIDVRDVAEAMIRAAEVGRIGERYIVGHWNTNQKELNQLIAKVAGVPPPWVPVPFDLARVGSKVGEWASRKILHKPPPVPSFFVEVIKHMQHYDCSKALHALNYPRSSVEAAIQDSITWFRENGYI